MFRKFTTILNQAVEALAPSTPLQEDYIYHWKAVTNYFLENKDDKRPIEQTNIPEHLEQMMTILVEEEQIGESGSTGPCMEYMLHHKLLDTLYTLGRTDCPPGMKQQVLVFFTKLLSRISQPLLPHINVHKAVQRLIRVCGEVKAAPSEAEEIQFLLTVCAKLRQDPYLVNFFLENSKSTSNNQTNQKNTQSGDKRFVLLDSLLALCHSADGRVGVKACEGLMLCASLPEESSADAILQKTAFCKEITNWLNMAYDRLPKTMDPSDIEGVEAKWGLDIVTAREDRTSFPGRRQLVSFISLLDFCDQLIHVAHPRVATDLARSIREHFLVPVLQPCLLQAAESASITATAHLIRCMRVISSCALVHEFELFIVGDGREPEVPGCEDHHLRHKLLERCNHLSEELSAMTLKLFDALLQVPSEHVIHNLVLRNLQHRSYLDPNHDKEETGQVSPRVVSPLHRTSGSDSTPSTKELTPHKQLGEDSSTESTLSAKELVPHKQLSDDSGCASNLSVVENSVESINGELPPLDDATGGVAHENSLTCEHIGVSDTASSADNTAEGAHNVTTDTMVVDAVNSTVERLSEDDPVTGQRQRFSSTGSDPQSPGFESELGMNRPLSPVNSKKPSVHRVVNYFLNLVPEDAKSSYQMADSGYDTYLRDAHRQFSEVSSFCRPWNWPKEAITTDESAEFYEGEFLKMIFGKVAHMLDQNYEVNLQVTSVISKLSLLPHPVIHEYLLNPFIRLKGGCRSIFTVFEKIERDLLHRLKGDPNMNRRLVTVRKQLMGVLKDQRSKSDLYLIRRSPKKQHDSRKTSEHIVGFEDSHTLEGIIVLEEFCKELAAIAFVKHHAIGSL